MKKSTVGMVLLVAMVLAKAYLVGYDRGDDGAVERTSMSLNDADELLSFRTGHEELLNVSPTINLLASNIRRPEIIVKQVVVNDVAADEHKDAAIVEPFELEREVSASDEVIPMDNVSDTGYGLWRTTTQKIKSIDDREGKVPLDGGSTISDNISKLFPRVP